MLLCVIILLLSSVAALYQHQIINNHIRPSQLWVEPALSKQDKKSHKFWSKFNGQHNGYDVLSNCTEQWITQYLDHYNYRMPVNGNGTYSERYFICGGASFKPNNTIFFYTGNEADVELYINATGLMWENADNYDAIMVFAEHRYFGQSLPFGSDEQDMQNENIVYLSADQAMADYAVLINTLKTSWNSWDSPVIGFGGSYGGMLCSWFRIKYPQWMDGCISASAPIISFMGEIPEVNYNFFADGETFDCKQEGGNRNDNCATNIHSSWDVIFNYAETQNGRNNLAEAFNLCSIPKTYEEGVNVAYWVSNAFGYMTMGSYPYSSSYMLNGNGTLPPYPMRVGCTYLVDQVIADNMTLLSSIREAAGVFYNYSGTVPCFDTNSSANNATEIDGILWNYLYCTEIFQTFGQNGKTDMFWNSPWNATETAKGCFENYGINSRIYWAEINYGGWLPFTSGSINNIVFSNGELDPWRGGGVTNLNNTKTNIYSITIPDAGHHIDLFFSNPNDTDAIRNARQFELDQITKWIKDKQSIH